MAKTERREGPRWLDVCRHRIRGIAVPYVLVLQHHIVAGQTRIVAPLVASIGERPTLLAPHIGVGTVIHRAILLEMAAAATRLIAEVVASAEPDADVVTRALDAIFRGYPVGLPL
jgi:hypothetical protein